MKKTINKICSAALVLATSATAVGAALIAQPNETKNVQVYADTPQAAATETYLAIKGGEAKASVGSDFDIPTAQLFVEGQTAPVELTLDDVKVYTPISKETALASTQIKSSTTGLGKFDVDMIGEYRIVYTKTQGGVTYVGTVVVKGEMASATIKTKTNTKRILPNKVWKGYSGAIYVPDYEVVFDNEEETIADTNIDVSIVVTDPDNQNVTYVTEAGDNQWKLNLSQGLKEGTYTVKYTATTKDHNVFIATETVEFEVLADTQYSSDYELKYDLGSMPTTADVGEEITLPEPTGKRDNEEVPVYYTIEAWTYEDGELVDVTAETINGNKFTANKKGDYVFYYNVTDALGKQAARKTLTLEDVDDTIAPNIKVVDGGYDVATAKDLEDVAHKLVSYTNGKNVVVKAIFAEDLADKTIGENGIKLTRTIKTEAQVGTSAYVYSDEAEGNEANFSKDLVFNVQTGYELNGAVNAGELNNGRDGKYTVYYKATDASGNSNTISYTFTVDSTFEFTEAPEVKFNDTFAKSVETGETIKFSAPTVDDEHDDRTLNTVEYRYNTVDVGGAYTTEGTWAVLTAEEDGSYKFKVDANKGNNLEIRAKAENDAQTTSVKYGYSDVVSIMITNERDASAPVIDNIGDAQANLVQNSQITLPDIVITDDYVDYVNVKVNVEHVATKQTFNVESGVVVRAANTYTLSGASFYATLSGDYKITYTAKDAAGNQVIGCKTITLSEHLVVEDPKFANLPESLTNGKLELGDEIVMPVPDMEVSSGYEKDYRVQVVKGSMNYELNKEKFVPQATGSYTIRYSLLTRKAGETDWVEQESARKEFTVEVVDTTNPEVRVEWNLNDYYDVDASAKIPVFSAYDISGIDLDASTIKITSANTPTVTIRAGEIEAELAKYAVNPETSLLHYTFTKNEKYTVTYTIFDKSNNTNSTVKSFTIKVGDLVKPVLDIEDDIVDSVVKIDSTLTIDTSKIEVSDNKTTDLAVSDVKIVVKNTDTNKVLTNIHEDDNTNKFEYLIETAGNYTVTFTVEDANGNEQVVTRTFTVSEETTSGMSSSEVVGTVLIVVSVLVLAGVVVYFIVSKKKLDKMYK
ncbi:MAG: hypothetical protein IJA69_05285 [Clostridia bacterium]|nr:hypothetical protein [Clostridia bacterium]